MTPGFAGLSFDNLALVVDNCREAVDPLELFRAAWFWALCEFDPLTLQLVSKVAPLPPQLTLEQLLHWRPVEAHASALEHLQRQQGDLESLKRIILEVFPLALCFFF